VSIQPTISVALPRASSSTKAIGATSAIAIDGSTTLACASARTSIVPATGARRHAATPAATAATAPAPNTVAASSPSAGAIAASTTPPTSTSPNTTRPIRLASTSSSVVLNMFKTCARHASPSRTVLNVFKESACKPPRPSRNQWPSIARGSEVHDIVVAFEASCDVTPRARARNEPCNSRAS
jgi:hypothetical protein